jgi:hypothetical protein
MPPASLAAWMPLIPPNAKGWMLKIAVLNAKAEHRLLGRLAGPCHKEMQ